ncbi:ATP-binding cassette domain-containing protein [Streptomyces sp. RB6PN25]|uniref:ATP-binding cassette domain-containing protein n=1 Tax=Streptomyces humicola TaxID=2953240 RepID=A0ABT1PV68_9ACTN|nr:ATP-binding cassette domain-containing protein [Streptomyces humicola]MCQ4081534.1 ATP-binding cassette domain-containing protein [Streptomyces humicola]
MEATTAPGAAVTAEGLGLDGPHGRVFRDVTLNAPAGSLIAIEGPSGSGRTCLLLTLTGRMRPTIGHATVAGLQLPRRLAAVRSITGLGPVDGVSELDPALTVQEHLRERALLHRLFTGPVSPRALFRPRGERAEQTRARIDEALAAAELDLGLLPKGPRTHVRDLERTEALRLGVALALLGRPRLLAVDDVDHKLSSADRAAAWTTLRAIAESGTTVLAVCTEALEGAVTVRLGAGRPTDHNNDHETENETKTKGAAADAYAEAGSA